MSLLTDKSWASTHQPILFLSVLSAAVLCGVPNHGVFDWDDNPGSEFNGRGPFLRELNAGESEVTPGTAFLTLRSDGMDKYAQADGRFVGQGEIPTVARGETFVVGFGADRGEQRRRDAVHEIARGGPHRGLQPPRPTGWNERHPIAIANRLDPK